MNLSWEMGDFHLNQYQSFQTQRFSPRTSLLRVSLKSLLVRLPGAGGIDRKGLRHNGTVCNTKAWK